MATFKATIYLFIEAESRAEAAEQVDTALDGGIAVTTASYLIGSIRQTFEPRPRKPED